MRYHITRLLSIAVLLLMAQEVRGQDSTITAPDAIILEAGGRGIFYSINYERLLSDRCGIMIGVGIYSKGDIFDRNALVLPVTFTFGTSRSASRIFFGAGITSILVLENTGVMPLPSLGIGYQYRPFHSSFLFKGEVMMAYAYPYPYFIPWAGLSVGHSF